MKTSNYPYAHAAFLSFILIFLVSNFSFASGWPSKTGHQPLGPDQQLLVNLMVPQPGGGETLLDGLRIRYNTGYQTSTADDILKMNNFGENISSYRENKELIVERRPMIAVHDTIFLRLTNLNIRQYRLKMYTLSFIQTSLQGFVEDTWLGTRQPIDLSGANGNFDFAVTADPASAATNRFMITFIDYTPLPVPAATIRAYQQNSNIAVEWTVKNERNMQQYDIERSPDSLHFSQVASIPAVAKNGATMNYSWFDTNPVTGNNYYRIRSLSQNGTAVYSSVVAIRFAWQTPGMTVFPNPITSQTFSIRFSDMPKGVYQLRISNMMGRLFQSQTWYHNGGNSEQAFRLADMIGTGVYQLEISGANGIHMTRQIRVLSK